MIYSKMTYGKLSQLKNLGPVAWMVHYKDDGELVTITTDKEKAEYYSKMAYHVTALRVE